MADPVAFDDFNTATEDGAIVSGNVGSNDTDADMDIVSFALVGPTPAGLTFNPDGSYLFNPLHAAYQSLAAGVTQLVTATYVVTDSFGGTDMATLTITVTGVNDAPVAADDTNTATEDGAAATGTVATDDTDVDTSLGSLTYSFTGTPPAGLTMLNPNGSYSFDPTNGAYQHIAQGATQIVVATYLVSDGQGGSDTGTLTITVTGTNDAPVALADADSATEGGGLVTGSVATNDSDVDDGAVLTYSHGALPAGLTINPNGSYSFDSNDAAYNGLAQGATQNVVANYTVTDQHGATDTETLTITVTGSNDAPVISGTSTGSASEAISLDGIHGADQTANNRLEPAINYDATMASLITTHGDDMAALLADLASQLPAGSGLPEAIAIVWDYVDDNFSYYNNAINEMSARLSIEYVLYLEDGGEPLTGIAAKYTPDGGDVGTAPDRYQSLHDNLLGNLSGPGLNDKLRGPPNGSNPSPDEQAYQDIIDLLEANDLEYLLDRPYYGGYEGEANLALADDQDHDLVPATGGQLTANDPDAGATQTWSGSATGTYGAFAIDSVTGAWTYTLNQFDPDTQTLAQGVTALDTFTATVSDGLGGSDTQLVTITVTGTNDAPVAMADTNTATEGASPAVTGSVATNDSDVDTGAVLTYALSAPIAGLTLNPNGSYSFDQTDAAYDSLAQGSSQAVVATYTVTDQHGASSSSTLTITVSGTNDAPVATDDSASATEGGAIVTGSVATNDSDVDQGAVLSYGPNGPLPAGFGFTPNGNYSFDPTDPAYNHLAAGVTENVTFDYLVTDAEGGSDAGTLTITVTGTNDAPVAVADTASATEGAAAVTGSVATNDSDVDDGAVLSYAFTGIVPAGLTMTNSNGSYSFDPSNAAYNSLADGVTQILVANYTVSDGLGGTDTETLTITITGTNDAPVVTGPVLLSATEGGGTYTVNPLANASDPDTGDSISVVPGTLPAGVTFVGSSWSTDFESYTPGTVVGQQGWTDGSPNSPDSQIVDLSGDNVLRLANDPTSGDFAGPYTPELSFSVGENGNGDTFSFSFAVKAVNSTADGSRIEIDLATSTQDDRYNFMALEYVAGGLRLVQNTPTTTNGVWQNNSFDFGTGNVQLGGLFDASVEHVITVIFRAVDGSNNDIVEYYVDGVLVGTGSSFENFQEFHVGQPHANAVREVTGLIFRAGDPAGNPFPADGPGGNRQGFYIDDLNLASYDSQQLHFNANDPAYDHLAQGATELVTVNYNVIDLNGGSTPASTVITVTGTNDAPVAVADTNSATEGAAAVTGSVATNDSDVDDGAVLTYAFTGIVPAGLTMTNPNGSYSFDPANAAYNSMPAGATQNLVATYTVSDGLGGTDTETLTITITGTNDAPVVTGAVTANATEDGSTVTLDPLANATDPDAGDSMVAVPVGPLPAGVSFVGASSTIDFTGYTLGSVVGQNGWTDASPSSPANAIVDVGPDRMLLLANDPSSGDFGGPYSPSLSFSVGETPTGADGDTLSFSFNFKAVSSTPDGSRIEIDLGTEGRDDRYNFMAIEHTATGLRLVQNTPTTTNGVWQNNSFNWETGNIQLGPDMDPNVEHTITVIFRAVDGSNNDIVEYYVDGVLVGTGSSFENFQEFHLAQPHASAVREVTNILFRAGEPAGNSFPQDGPGGQRAGFYIDDLTMQAFDSRQLQFDPNHPAYDHLGAGITENVTVNYNVVDGKGGVTPATAVITVTGVNDTAVISGDSTGSATETNAVLTVTGDLDVVDIDDGESVFVAQTNTDGTYGAFSVDTAGEWTYVTDNAQNQFAQGQTYVDTFTVASADGTTQNVTITITGSNDAPVANDDTASATEDGPIVTGSVATNDTDVDLGATHSWTLNAPVAGLTLNPNGSYIFNTLDPAYQSLRQGVTQNVVATYTMTDQHGATDMATLTITVTGTNDAPVANDDTASATEDGAIVTGDVSLDDTDIDSGDTRTYTLNGTVPGLSINPNGTYSFDPGDAAYDHIAQGATQTVNAVYTMTDGSGATDTATLVITVTGVNDAVVAVADSDTVSEAGVSPGNTPFPGDPSATGNVLTNDTDVDDGATRTVSAVGGGSVGSPVAGTYGSVTINSDGSYTYSLDNGDTETNALAQGATVTDTFTYTAMDQHGTTSSTTLTITITGTNDAPVANDDTNAATEDGAVVNGTVATNDSDVDTGATATYALSGTVDGLTLNPNGSYSFDPSDAAYQHIAQGATQTVVATYIVSDQHGATDTATLTITVTGVNDAPVGVADSDTASESGVNPGNTSFPGDPIATGNVLANDTDVDDGATRTVSAVAGGSVGSPVTGTYGSVTINGDGSYTYMLDNGDADTNALAQGASVTDTFTYTVADQHGATSSTTLTINITGTNDAPVANDDTNAATEDGAVVNGTVATNDSDVDTGATATYALSGTVDGLTLNPNGSYSFDPSDAAYQHIAQGATQTVVATYIVSDQHGATDTATLTITVAGTNDAPVVTGAVTASVNEGGGTITIDPLANASDPDDGDGLVAVPVGPLPAGVSFVGASSTIDFESYSLGSVVGQNGWTDASPSSPDNEILDVSGDRMLRLSNDPTSGDFGGPYSPSLSFSVGETSTGANGDTLSFSFNFKPVSNTPDGSRIEIDLGTEGRDDRYNFMAIEHTATGLRLVQNTPQADGDWENNSFAFETGNVQLGPDIDPNVEHTITVIFRAVDGSDNDIIEYYVDGVLVGTGSTFENFQEFHLAQPHASAVREVTNVFFRAAEPAGNPFPADGPGGNRAGFYIDDLSMAAYDSRQLQFDANDPAYDHLAQGVTEVVTVNYNVVDGNGGVTPATTVITVTGTNDGPVAVADTDSATEGAPAVTGSVATNDSDVDDGAVLTYAFTGIVPAGLTMTNPNGSYSFDPSNAAYDHLAEGVTQVLVTTYVVTDEHGASSSSTLTITLTGTNDAPVGVADSDTASESGVNPGNTPFPGDPIATGNVLANDTDVDDGATRTVSAVAGGSVGSPVTGTYGSVTINGDGSYTYMLDNGDADTNALAQGASVTDTFTYTVADQHGATSSTTLTITITGTNDAPDAVNDNPTVSEDGPVVNGSVATNDSDADTGAALTYTLDDPAPTGFTFNADGSYSFDRSSVTYQALAQGETQTITLDYTVTDEHGATDTAVLTITVNGVNDAPVGNDDTNTATEDGAVVFGTVATNDTDVDNGATRTFALSAPVDGLTVNPDGSYVFNPLHPAYQSIAQGATQNVVATYIVTDEHGATDTATLTITVTGVNDAPVANDDANTAVEDGAVVTGNVGANDSDVDNGATRTYALDAPLAGLTLNPDGSYSFDPSHGNYQHIAQGATQTVVASYTATDQHGATDTATLTITVLGTNDAPVANDDIASATEDGAVVTGTVATNDTDIDDGATRTYALSAPVAGLTLNPDGSYSFDPSNTAYQHLAVGATQVVTATYAATDQHGASDTATLTITVSGANDTPVANDDTRSVAEGAAPITGNVGANDTDVDDGATHTFAANHALPAGLIFGANGSYSFNPNNAAYQSLATGETQDVSLSYTITDEHGASDTATLTITVTGTNDAPIANDDIASATEDGAAATGNVGTNDTDVDNGATRTYALDSAVAGLTLNPDGSYSFDPGNAAYDHIALGATQTVVASYTATDDQGASDAATLTITVTGINDAPVANNDTISATEDGAIVTGTFATNDTDIDDGATRTYALIAPVAGLTLNPDGSYSFDPGNAAYQSIAQGATLNLIGAYRATDEHGATDPATITITVTGVNDAPVANDDVNSATEDGAVVTGTVVINDSDVDSGDVRTYALDAPVAGLTLNPDGSYSFDPSHAAYQSLAEGATQNVVATYIVSDQHGATDTATLTITITGVNDAPVALDDTNSATEGGALVSGNVGSNDSDVDAGATLTYAPAGPLPAGFIFGPNGNYSFDPTDPAYDSLAAGVTQNLVFAYTVADEHGATDTATLTITVTGVNDAAVITGDTTGSTTETNAVLTVTGDLDVTDVDGDDVFVTQTGTDGIYGSFSIDADGEWSYVTDDAVNQLAAGQTYTDTFTVASADGTTQNVAIAITGSNDAPVANDDTDSATEDGAVVIGNVGTNDTDVDLGATRTYALNAPVAGLTLAGNGGYVFNPLHPAYQSLAAGATQNVVATYTATDEHGATDTATLTITVTGVNDAPVANDDANTAIEDGAAAVGNVGANDSDVDNGATRTYALDAPLAGLTLNANGSYSFDPSNAAYQHIAQGATQTVVASYTATDQHGATDTATLTITVLGTNDAPVANDDVASATEDGAVVTGTVATNDTDIDDGATRTYALSAPVAGLTLNPDGSYSFDPSNTAYQHLAVGATQVVTATYAATDQHGASDTATLTITVSGANDAPVANDDTASATEDGASANGNVGANDTDVDDGAMRTYALVAPVAGLTLNPDGSYNFDPTHAAYQSLAAGATQSVVATYTATDDQGATDTATLTVTVTGVDDAAVVQSDAFATDEATVVQGNVFDDNGSGADTDIDNPLTVTQVNGAAVVGTEITLASGALLTLNADGTFDYDPNDAFDAIPAAGSGASNLSQTDSFTYTLSDGGSATVTVTITGLDTKWDPLESTCRHASLSIL